MCINCLRKIIQWWLVRKVLHRVIRVDIGTMEMGFCSGRDWLNSNYNMDKRELLAKNVSVEISG